MNSSIRDSRSHAVSVRYAVRNRIFVLVAAVLAPTAAAAQTQELPAGSLPEVNDHLQLNWKDVERNIWNAAKPYLDYPLPELEQAVPELKGLEPASSQEQLSSLLERASEKCVDLLRRTPNVISHEEVITESPHVKPWRQEFEYLLVARRTQNDVELEEYRTDKHGRPLNDQAAEGPHSQGLASMWVHLYPGNRGQSRFRYLGQQQIDKHKTFVLAFAQIPDLVKHPGQFRFRGTWISLLYQGVAWIDSTDFRIVHMREDLLAPRPDAYLKKLAASVRFDEVNISKAASSLWLPQEAVVEWDFNGRIAQERHLYSHYRLYAVKSRILPTHLKIEDTIHPPTDLRSPCLRLCYNFRHD